MYTRVFIYALHELNCPSKQQDPQNVVLQIKNKGFNKKDHGIGFVKDFVHIL
jgi:hypothetical protein